MITLYTNYTIFLIALMKQINDLDYSSKHFGTFLIGDFSSFLLRNLITFRTAKQ